MQQSASEKTQPREGSAATIRVQPLSSRMRYYRQLDGVYEIAYPEN